jgi:secreted PhoX family phosphatase
VDLDRRQCAGLQRRVVRRRTEGANRGETKQFLTVPLGAETCGPVITDDLVTVSVQHPGEHDDNDIDNPLSRWPEGGNGTARPSVVAVWKTDGNIGA